MLNNYLPEEFKHFIQKSLPISQIFPLPLHARGKTYITIALQRSGHHAVINWLSHHLQSAIHMNHCTFIRHHTNMMIIPCGGRFVYYKNQERFDSGLLIKNNEKRPLKLFKEKLYHIGKFDNIIYSFEEASLKDDYLNKFIQYYSPRVLLILRDPYNCFASLFQHHNGKNTLPELIEKKQKLISYLKQALGIDNYLNYPVFPIDYGKWVQNNCYRKHLLQKLQIPFSQEAEDSMSQVQPFGEGSSFDGTKVDYESLQKRVFERWKKYQYNTDYLTLLNDPILSRLTFDFFKVEKPF